MVGHGKLLYDGTGGRTSDREVPFEGHCWMPLCPVMARKVCRVLSLEDFRVGFKATYRQYEMKADIGLGGNKSSHQGFVVELSL